MRKQVRELEITDVDAQSEPDHASSSRSASSYNWRAHWLTANEFARVMGREPQTIYKWLRNGTLAEFGIPVCQFRSGRLHSGRFFILNIY